MHADAFFQAVRHGQDYARSTPDCAVISDGCSSSPDTDCGARLLTLVASTEADIERVLDRALGLADGLLPVEALDATLWTARAVGEAVVVEGFGDGLVFARRRDGALAGWVVDHGGVPAYPTYRRQPGRWRSWSGTARVQPLGVADERPLAPGFPRFSLCLPMRDWQVVGVASDGWLSLVGPDGPVAAEAVLPHLTDIRVARGRFLERAATHFLRRTAPRLGWTPTDDVSAAALWLDAE